MGRTVRVATSSAIAVAALSTTGIAEAHHGSDPEFHRSMPNQVFAGVTPICNERFEGSLGRGGGDADLGATSIYCIGVTIGFAREIGRDFELRLRVGYEKPYSDEERLRDDLHVLRATVALDLLAYRLADRLTLTVGPEAGLLGAFLTASDPSTKDIDSLGWTVGATAGIRTWVTYHTGFFWELGAGVGRVNTTEIDLRNGFLGRISVGWADRF